MRKIILFVSLILSIFTVKAQSKDNIYDSDIQNMHFLSLKINYLIDVLNLKKVQLKEDSLILCSIQSEIYFGHSSKKKKIKEAKRYIKINSEMKQIQKEMKGYLLKIKYSFKEYKFLKENIVF